MRKQSLVISCILIWVISLCSGCTSGSKRGPAVPAALGDQAEIPGIPGVRVWGDVPPTYTDEWLSLSWDEVEQRYPGIVNTDHTYLAISGGGASGAFGAGLLVGWTETGTRPEFTIVTGVSTGALIAPFAFLGPDYDEHLREVYTSYSTKDMARVRSLLQILRSDAAADNRGMRALIRKHYNEDIVKAVARRASRGRHLKICTVNLDASRPVIWDMGMIASSDHPQSVKLFQDVIIASASIPVAFSPVYFDVEVEGQDYQEMHVDGGTVQQMFLYPSGLNWSKVAEKLEVRGKPRLYLIRNSRMLPSWQEVKPSVLSIAGRSAESLERSESIGDLYRLYVNALNEGMDYNLAYIPAEFTVKSQELFDRNYMCELFEFSRKLGKEGYDWLKEPPEIIVPQ